MIRLRDYFLSESDLQKVHEEVNKLGYTYGWRSTTKPAKPDKNNDTYRHWNCNWAGKERDPGKAEYTIPADVIALPEIFQSIWARLNKNNDLDLVRLYSNAYTYGTEGNIHKDSSIKDNITHLIYINMTWRADWAGETVFLDKNDEIYRAILPSPGRLVEFAGDIPHAARSVTKFCPVVRQVIVFKSNPKKKEQE